MRILGKIFHLLSEGNIGVYEWFDHRMKETTDELKRFNRLHLRRVKSRFIEGAKISDCAYKFNGPWNILRVRRVEKLLNRLSSLIGQQYEILLED